MIRGVAETAGIEPRVTARAASGKPVNGGGFAAELDRETKKDVKKTPSAKNAQVPERTTPVAGHPYAEITAGPRNGMFLNTSGNERDGQAFLVVEREGRTFHVYGTGENRAVFEVKPHPAPKAPAAAAPGPATTAPTTTTNPVPAVPTSPAVPAVPGVTTPVLPVALPGQLGR